VTQHPAVYHVARYGLALAAVGLGFNARLWTSESLGSYFPYLLFYPGIMLAARFGGFGPGAVATFLSAALAAYYYMEPAGSFLVARRSDQVSLPLFVAFGLLISWSSESLRRAERRQRDLAALANAQAQAEQATSQRLAATRDELLVERRRVDDLVRDVPGVVWQAWGDPASPAGQRLDFVSGYAFRLLGYEPDQWPQIPNFWLSIVHPDDRDRAMREAHELYRAGFGGVIEFRWMGRDGREVWVESHVRTIQERGASVGMRGGRAGRDGTQATGARARRSPRAGAGVQSREGRVHRHRFTRASDSDQRRARVDANVARRHPLARSRRAGARGD